MESTWIIYALLSALFAAFVAIFGKIGLEGVDSNTATAVRAVIMALFLCGVLVAEGKLADVKPIIFGGKTFFFIILSGIAGALSWLFYFIALKNAKVSQIVPIDRMSVVFALILAFLLLGEKVSTKAALGAALVVIGGILIALA